MSDFSELNKYAKQPIQAFPSSTYLINKINTDSKIFAKFDAVKGYFQIPPEESSFKDVRNPLSKLLTAPKELPDHFISVNQFNEIADHYTEKLEEVPRIAGYLKTKLKSKKVSACLPVLHPTPSMHSMPWAI